MDTSLEELYKSMGDIECPHCHGKFYLDRPLEDALRAQLAAAQEQVRQYRAALEDGVIVVAKGVELIGVPQWLGRWPGVRAWQEQVGALLDDGTPYAALDAVKGGD